MCETVKTRKLYKGTVYHLSFYRGKRGGEEEQCLVMWPVYRHGSSVWSCDLYTDMVAVSSHVTCIQTWYQCLFMGTDCMTVSYYVKQRRIITTLVHTSPHTYTHTHTTKQHIGSLTQPSTKLINPLNSCAPSLLAREWWMSWCAEGSLSSTWALSLGTPVFVHHDECLLNTERGSGGSAERGCDWSSSSLLRFLHSCMSLSGSLAALSLWGMLPPSGVERTLWMS